MNSAETRPGRSPIRGKGVGGKTALEEGMVTVGVTTPGVVKKPNETVGTGVGAAVAVGVTDKAVGNTEGISVT